MSMMTSGVAALEEELDDLIGSINNKYFPNDYRYKIAHEGLDEKAISQAAMAEVKRGWRKLRRKHSLVLTATPSGSGFLDTWYAAPVLKEALAARELPATDAGGGEKTADSNSVPGAAVMPHNTTLPIGEPGATHL